MQVLPTFVRPIIAYGSHPVDTGRYVIATPPICALYEQVKRWICNRAPGGMIHGKQRFGKTRAIKYIMDQLPADIAPRIPIFLVIARDYQRPSEGTFFQDILRAVEHAFTGGKPADKRNRVLEFFHERAIAGWRNRLVVIIDEAQKLHEMHYRWLVDLHNELEDRRGVSTTWILVGQHELVHQRDVFVASKKTQIIGRFFVHRFQFHGLRSLDDVKDCLTCYDDPDLTEYPLNSGWSYSRYYFPAAYANGWRLEHQADVLWETFNKVRIEHKLPGKGEIPMQYLAHTVEYALRKCGTLDEIAEPISVAVWREAIMESGYHDAARYV